MGLKLHENPRDQEPCQSPESEYERSREERIRQNLEKMKKLGLVELSLGLKRNTSALQPRRVAKNNNNNKTPPSVSPLRQCSEPSRRSSRLKNTSPVTYSEVKLYTKIKEPLLDDEGFAGESYRPEIYNKEHVKMLGSTDKSWTLFVDGYGSNGKRIYDPINGKTCHQCRQKTLGYRTHCIECNKVQGQFCGDCLYMRYGEHVLEANDNPDWVCPVCRGICNCSLCRQAKGWAPTGPLSTRRSITQLGFKSVAHYLIQTHYSEANNDITANEVSAKRSLAFSEQLEVKSDDEKDSSKQPLAVESIRNVSKSCSRDVNEIPLDKEMVQESFARNLNSGIISGKIMERDEGEDEKQKEPPLKMTPKHKQKLALFHVPSQDSIGGKLRLRRDMENPEEVQPADFEILGDNNTSDSIIGARLRQRCKTSDVVEPEKHKEEFLSDGDCCTTPLKAATTPKLKQNLALVSVPSGDSIGGRLRQRRMDLAPVKVFSSKSSESIQTPLKETEHALLVVPSSDSKTSDLVEPEKHKEEFLSDGDCCTTPLKAATTPKLKQNLALVSVPSGDSIGGRLRQRRMDSAPVKVVSSESSESIQTPLKETEHALVVVPSSDSIGGRLRLRRMDSTSVEDVSSRSSESIPTPLKETPKLNLNQALVLVPSSESIGGRLRQRRMDSTPVNVVSSESSESIRTPLKEMPKLNLKKALVVVPSSDSIGGRLRQRRMDSTPVNVLSFESGESIQTPLKETPKPNQKQALVVVPNSDSIGGRLRQRRMDLTPVNIVSSESSESIQTPLKKMPKLNLKRALVVVPGSDSIGGRLRQRRKMSDVEVL